MWQGFASMWQGFAGVRTKIHIENQGKYQSEKRFSTVSGVFNSKNKKKKYLCGQCLIIKQINVRR
jgi:hypothetical protein